MEFANTFSLSFSFDDVLSDFWIAGLRSFKDLYFIFVKNMFYKNCVKKRTFNVSLCDKKKKKTMLITKDFNKFIFCKMRILKNKKSVQLIWFMGKDNQDQILEILKLMKKRSNSIPVKIKKKKIIIWIIVLKFVFSFPI